MSSSIQKNKFTQGIIALIFIAVLCAPISITKVSATHLLSVSSPLDIFSENSVFTPALAQAQTNPPQATTEKVDSSGSEVFTKLAMILGNLILGIGAFFAWATGKILDYSLESLVFGMGNLINTGGVGVAIDAAWKIIRDFCNLAFIFGFIYLGIRTIIDPENSSVKRTLSQIIIGALLINFSLYIAKFIIDLSNFTAFSIYNALVTGTGSISGLMFHMLGVTSFYSKGVLDTQQFANVTGGGMFAFYIMGLILFLIAAFIFISAAILIVIRFVALVFLMIASPVLFAATVFPQTESTAKMLWGKLFSYSFFAPLYLLLTLISLMVMQSFTTVMSGGNKLSATLSNSSAQLDAFGVVVSFIVVIFFLTNSLLISKKLGVYGADKMIGVGTSMRKGAQGYLGRGAMNAGFTYNGNKYSVGAVASRIQKNTSSPTLGRFAGTVTGAKFGSGRSYAENEKEKKEYARRGINATQSKEIKNKVTAGSQSGATLDQKIAMERAVSTASSEQVLALAQGYKEGDERNAFIANLSASQFDGLMKAKEEDFDEGKKAELRKVRAKLLEKKHNIDQETTAPNGVVTNSGAGKISKMDGSELDGMDFNTVLKHANHLSSKQIDDMKSLTPTAKTHLKDARKSALIDEFNAVNAGGPTAGAATLFGRITSETERAKLPVEILNKYESARYLTQGILTKMLDNDSIPDTERADIKNNVEGTWAANATKSAAFQKFFNDTPAGNQYL